MKTKVILFDLDGTLLPFDQDIFTKIYFGLLVQKLAPKGYQPKALIDAIWKGTEAMARNNGDKTNEEVFWDKFVEIFGEKAREDEATFKEFYIQDFDKVKVCCQFNPQSKEVIDKIKKMGYRVAIATNPFFPSIATEKRIKWAGLNPKDFEFFTTYEKSRHSKPNPEYYIDVAKQLGVQPEECLMVGNDVAEDMVAEMVGMKVFLVTDCLINKQQKDISIYPHGNFEDLLNFIKQL